MFGHSALMNRNAADRMMQKMTKGTFIDTGDSVSGDGGVATTEDGSGDTGEADGGETDTDDNAGDVDVADQQKKQSPEDDARYANERRKAELDAAKKELADYRALMKEYEQDGFTDPKVLAEAVRRERQQRAIQQQQAQQAQAEQAFRQQIEEAKQAGWDVEPFLKMMQHDPEKVHLRQSLAALQNHISAQENRTAQEKQNQALMQKLQSDHAFLQKKYGDLVPSLDKIGEVDPETVRIMREESLPLKAAWIQANVDKITAQTKKSTKQKTLNSIDGKRHLKTEGDGASGNLGDVNIPESTLQYYMDNGYTKKQAMEHYKKLYS